jgi:predicted acylesterase/phospholipase RssA
VEAFQGLSHAIRPGIFNSSGIDKLLRRLFSSGGRSNDFRQLKHRLFIVATDLDTGESVAFGSEGARRSAHFGRGAGERRPAGPVSAGQDRRAAILSMAP